MIRECLFIFPVLFLSACSIAPLNLRTEKASQDIFREESFLRYSHGRLQQFNGTPYEALAKCHKGNWEEGLDWLKKEVLSKKQAPNYWNQVGVCYFMGKNYAKASFYFDLALKKNGAKKHYVPALNNMGVVSLHLKHYQRALDYFKLAHRRQPSLIVPQFNLAQLYLRFHLLIPAKNILERLYRRNNRDVEIIYSVARLYLLEGKLDAAEKLFSSIPKEERRREDIALSRSLTFYQQKKYTQAQSIIESQSFDALPELKKSAERLLQLIRARIKEAKLASVNTVVDKNSHRREK